MMVAIYGGGANPPVRLDKWQNIISVGWGNIVPYLFAQYSVLVDFTAEFPDQSPGGSYEDKPAWISENYLSRIEFRSTTFQDQEWQGFFPDSEELGSDGLLSGTWKGLGYLTVEGNTPPLPSTVTAEPFVYGARTPNFYLTGDISPDVVFYDPTQEGHLPIIGIRTEYGPDEEGSEGNPFPVLTPFDQIWVAGTSCPIACKATFAFNAGAWPQYLSNGSPPDLVRLYGGQGDFLHTVDNPRRIGGVNNVDFEGPDIGTPAFDLSGLTATYKGATYTAVGFRRLGTLAVGILYKRDDYTPPETPSA